MFNLNHFQSPLPKARGVHQKPIQASTHHKSGRLFRSFWMGGFEGADHRNSNGDPLELNITNGHWQQLAQDYALLASVGIGTIRESIGWRASTSTTGKTDLTALRHRAEIAQAHGLQVIWTIHHYGLPESVDFFDSNFSGRFADFCDQVSRALKGVNDEPPIYQPMNEISFLTWAATYSNLIFPFDRNLPHSGYELKCRLVAATLRGCDAIWRNEPHARVVHTDPIVHVTAAPAASPDEIAAAANEHQHQFEAWDMICGRLEPSLGGAPRYLDIIGANYYHDNQWEHPGQGRLHWYLNDPRRRPLDQLLGDVWQRYHRPLFISETGHVGAGRASWLDEVAKAALQSMKDGVPLEGICLYPLLDRTDWEQPERWHRSGLWDVRRLPAHACNDLGVPAFSRTLHKPLAQRLQHWQTLISPGGSKAAFIHNQPEVLMSPIIVFSHLRWDFVYQRPQQLLSRLAAKRQVIFIEEPIPDARQASLERMHPCQGVEVIRCHVQGSSVGFSDSNLPAMKLLLQAVVDQIAFEDYWLWFYTPMALPLAALFQPAGVVYDCMDELSAFKNAPPQLLQREDQLFSLADLVFTGGYSLYEAKSQRHPDVTCFPSSVDAAHYARPGPPAGQTVNNAVLTATQPMPKLGYCGVIDERIDIELIAALAQARPDWQIVMVGPVVKIDPAGLPQNSNISWLGQRDYADLPGLMHGWDVCLMPFALNEATRFISPTKTLEYLAAGCPVVSTPIRDVVSSYSNLVAIADTPEKFIAACDAAVKRTPAEITAAATAVGHLLERTSWDRTAAAMAQLMEDFGKATGNGDAQTLHQPLQTNLSVGASAAP